MKKMMVKMAVLPLVVSFVGCAGVSPIQEHEGKTVYSQINIWEEGQEHITTNYRVSAHIPINSKIEIVDSNGKEIQLLIKDSNQAVEVVNVEDYSGQDVEGIYNRYFADAPRDLSGFDADTRNAIENGEVKKGMSKEAVLLARGYPPAHRTPSLDEDLWVYWRNRFARQTVEFENGKVSELVGF